MMLLLTQMHFLTVCNAAASISALPHTCCCSVRLEILITAFWPPHINQAPGFLTYEVLSGFPSGLQAPCGIQCCSMARHQPPPPHYTRLQGLNQSMHKYTCWRAVACASFTVVHFMQPHFSSVGFFHVFVKSHTRVIIFRSRITPNTPTRALAVRAVTPPPPTRCYFPFFNIGRTQASVLEMRAHGEGEDVRHSNALGWVLVCNRASVLGDQGAAAFAHTHKRTHCRLELGGPLFTKVSCVYDCLCFSWPEIAALPMTHSAVTPGADQCVSVCTQYFLWQTSLSELVCLLSWCYTLRIIIQSIVSGKFALFSMPLAIADILKQVCCVLYDTVIIRTLQTTTILRWRRHWQDGITKPLLTPR